MTTINHKTSLLKEIIGFSVTNEGLSKKEYDFSFLIANKLEIERGVFIDLVSEKIAPTINKSPFMRFQQFYKLAFIMYTESLLDLDEFIGIQQIAISMGLDTAITKKLLVKMKKNPEVALSNDTLLKIFNEVE